MTRPAFTRTRGLLRSLLFLLPVMVLLPHMDDFAYLAGAAFSDMAVSHYPNLLFLQRALQSGTIPLWSPAILSGTPFAANPLSGLWYPPGWLALLFPLPLGINLVLAMHIVWGGAGMYQLLRQEGLGEGPALFGALAFEALPKVFSHLGAGHVTLIFAVAWTPWLLYAEGRWGGVRLVGGAGRPVLALVPGIMLGLIALADPRWAAYAGMVWLAYRLRRILRDSHSHKGQTGIEKHTLLQGGLTWAANGLAALVTAAPLLVPLAEYTRLSGRAALTAGDSLAFSLPPGQLFGLVYPYIAGMAEWVLYPGAAVAALVVYALCVPVLRRSSRFWLGLALLSGVVALGSNVPLAALIWQAPGFNLLRVPSRALFLTGLGLAAAAGFAVQHLICYSHAQAPLPGAAGEHTKREWTGMVLFACAAFLALFGAAAWLVVPDALPRIRFAWGAVFFTLSAGLILLARAGKVNGRSAFAGLVVLCLVDLCAVNGLSLDFRSASATATAASQSAAFLRERENGLGTDSAFRVYSPSYSIPQHIAAEYGLELADGVDPLRLLIYDRFMEQASGVPLPGYSVTMPPFANGDPAEDNRAYTPNAAMLALLNVKYVTAEYPLIAEGLTPLAQFGSTYLYQNTLALPRAWVQPADAAVGTQALAVERVERTPNTVTVTARGPGLLVLSEINYPGWTARVDGRQAPVQTSAGLMRAVPLSVGEHVVVFAFRPCSVYAGAAIGGLGWVVFAALALSGGAAKRKGQL